MTTTDDPEYRTAYYVSMACPACGVPVGVHRDRRELSTLPMHPGPSGDICWVTGWTVAEAKAMVAMQWEDGGRLTRAAHP
jgi:hypothetical protein